MVCILVNLILFFTFIFGSSLERCPYKESHFVIRKYSSFSYKLTDNVYIQDLEYEDMPLGLQVSEFGEIFGKPQVSGNFDTTITSYSFSCQLKFKIVDRTHDFVPLSFSDVFQENWYIDGIGEWKNKNISFPIRKATTRYYKTSFEFYSEHSLISYLKMALISDGGMIIYINGRIVYRRGLGQLYSQDEESKKYYSSTSIKELRITPAILKVGVNTIGIEVHRHKLSTVRDPFEIRDLDFVSESSECTTTNTYEPTMLINSNRGFEYERSNATFESTTHVVNNLNLPTMRGMAWEDGFIVHDTPDGSYDFPHNNYEQQLETNPLTIEMGYPDDIARTFTQYTIVVNFNNQQQSAPWSWTFYGSYDNTTNDWDILQEVTDADFSTVDKTRKTFQLLDQYQSYEYFKMKFTSKKDIKSNVLFLFRLHVQYCKPKYCEANGEFPKSIAGFTSSIPFKPDNKGPRERKCLLDNNRVAHWEGDTFTSLNELLPSFDYPPLVFKKGYFKEITPLFDTRVIHAGFETNCTFPKGISFYPSSGKISGKSSDYIDGNLVQTMKCSVTMKQSEKAGYSKIFDFKFINIIFNADETCPEKNGYPETGKGEIATKPCPDGQIGNRTMLCNDQSEWEEEEEDCSKF